MKKILIVGTAPYDKNCQSRAFESYFNGISSKYLAQIFTYPYKPPKGHCSTLYQITDAMMLKRFFSKKEEPGIIYNIDSLDENGGIVSSEVYGTKKKKNSFIKWLYKKGKKKSPLMYLLRDVIWKKNNWCTSSLNEWLDDFKPECVFLSFSDDFFILKIALYVANRFNIPIISSIADDYYFYEKKSISPFYFVYRKRYKKLVNQILQRKNSSAIYIGDRIKNQYNRYFGLNGETMYLTSNIVRKPFKEIDSLNPIFSYFGNVRLGRYKSLIEFGEAIFSINPNYHLNVYTNETDKKYLNKLKKAKGICFLGKVPYTQVMEGMLKSDVLLIVEGFEQKNINKVKYSISTKIPDSLSTGSQVIAYGDKNCGAIDYLLSVDCLPVCTSKNQLTKTIVDLLNDKEKQKYYYIKMEEIIKNNHSLKNNNHIFEELIRRVIKE